MEMRKYEGKILECKYDAPSNKWEMLRERTDKSFPNAFSTADCKFYEIVKASTSQCGCNNRVRAVQTEIQ